MPLRLDYIQRAGLIHWRTSDSQIVHQSVGGAVVTIRLVATFLLSNEARRQEAVGQFYTHCVTVVVQ